jgi:hypothetical protein
VYWTSEKNQVICGCFKGSIEEFEKAIVNTHGENDFAKAYLKWLGSVKNYMESL